MPRTVDDPQVGSYALTVTADDGTNPPQAATVTIEVTPVNDAPVAAPVDLGAIDEDGSRLITPAELLAGVTDVDGPAATITALSIQSGSGTLVQHLDGTWTFTPTADDDTDVTFAYTASDGEFSASSTATLDLTPVNDAPVASPVDLGAIDEDGSRLITSAELLAGVTDVDGPAANITDLAIQSGNGTLVDNGDATWTYTPAANDDTDVTFAYTASDGEFSASSTASLDLTPVNDPPVIADQSFSVAEESLTGAAVGTVLASDVDDTSLMYAITAGNDLGLFAIDANTGAITLAQDVDDPQVGSYALTVTADDGTNPAQALPSPSTSPR